ADTDPITPPFCSGFYPRGPGTETTGDPDPLGLVTNTVGVRPTGRRGARGIGQGRHWGRSRQRAPDLVVCSPTRDEVANERSVHARRNARSSLPYRKGWSP